MDNLQEPIQETKSKKTVERSAAYPGYTIEDSLSFLSEFYKHFRSAFAKRDDIVNLIEGTKNSKIASCGHYGLLLREKDTYQVTELYKTIVNHLTEQEKRLALLQAFISPTLNKELTDKFDGDIVPEKLSIHLHRFHRITEVAAPGAADVFIRNAKYIGIFGDDRKLCYAQVLGLLASATSVIPSLPLPDGEQHKSVKEIITEAPIGLISSIAQQPTEQVKQPILIPETTNEEKLTMKLTDGRRAYLSYPRDLNEKDIAILKLQLEALALTL